MCCGVVLFFAESKSRCEKEKKGFHESLQTLFAIVVGTAVVDNRSHAAGIWWWRLKQASSVHSLKVNKSVQLHINAPKHSFLFLCSRASIFFFCCCCSFLVLMPTPSTCNICTLQTISVQENPVVKKTAHSASSPVAVLQNKWGKKKDFRDWFSIRKTLPVASPFTSQ